MTDPIFESEQAKLDETYKVLLDLKEQLEHQLNTTHASAVKELQEMSQEVRLNFNSADETMETLAAIEGLNSIIDIYNQYHDFSVEKLSRVMVALRSPYFAKVSLIMRKGAQPTDVYIGAAGITDEHKNPVIVDWRSPVAETYYNQDMGETSYVVNGKTKAVELVLRRQFDIAFDKLRNYFDTTVAIEDSLLLAALKREHGEKLTDITASIQKEQNTVVRHEDVPVMLVDGIAGSGKTSVMLQRIAYLLYQLREKLSPEQIYLFTPNEVFESYINMVLPSLGEKNPTTHTWRSFLADLGLGDHDADTRGSEENLERLESALPTLEFEEADFKAVTIDGTTFLKPAQIAKVIAKHRHHGLGSRMMALAKDELHERVRAKITRLSKTDDLQEEMLGLDLDEQMEIFGQTIMPQDEEETNAFALTYARHKFDRVHDEVDKLTWLRIDRIGMRILGADHISAADWLYLRLLISGAGDRETQFVMIDEVQDYTEVQLKVLAKYFSRAHFLLLGDKNQAIYEDSASFDTIREIFSAACGSVETLRLPISYRSSPAITDVFVKLAEQEPGIEFSSIQRDAEAPIIKELPHDSNAYLTALKEAIADEQTHGGLIALVCADSARANWLAKQLDEVTFIQDGEKLPASGVISLSLALAKGLEFDSVIIPDASSEVYGDGSELSRKRLYTAISRAIHRLRIYSQGEICALLKD